MVTRKINNIEFLQILRGLNKPYFTVADLEKVLALKRDVLYVALNRLVKNRTLIRLRRGVYTPEFQSFEFEKTANELYYPSYVSFESALSSYGILSQIPYSVTLATSKPTKKLTLNGREIEYRQLKDELFFGYILQDGIYIAEPEKAVLDELYLISKGKAVSDVNEWSFIGINKKKLLLYAKKFPLAVQERARALVFKLGKYTSTLETKENFK